MEPLIGIQPSSCISSKLDTKAKEPLVEVVGAYLILCVVVMDMFAKEFGNKNEINDKDTNTIRKIFFIKIKNYLNIYILNYFSTFSKTLAPSLT
jgi:hypothetical protein